jgi:predicted nucleic acid-binding protein
MSGARVFVDTNVLVYAYDLDAGQKHQIALDIMRDLWRSGLGVLSSQTLQEFFVTVTRKIPLPIEVPLAKEIIKRLSKWDVVTHDMEIVLEAIELHQRFKLSFWDSLIVASAIAGSAGTILSEDFSDDQTIMGTSIKNPFA